MLRTKITRRVFLLSSSTALAVSAVGRTQVLPASTGTASGIPFHAGNLRGIIDDITQTLVQLSPDAEPGFSYVPTWQRAKRAGDGHNNLGDLNLRVRMSGGEWRDFSSAHRRKPVRPLAREEGVVAAADITATMGENPPFAVERRWILTDGRLALRFRLTNRGSEPLEIGGLGLPMVFDNILTGRNLDQAHTLASFVEPYIGRDAGYLQVTRLGGEGPVLLVLPEAGTPLEAYVPLKSPKEDIQGAVFTENMHRDVTFEGFYAWTVHSKGFFEKEWKTAGEQWNTPTSRTLSPGQATEFGVRFVTSAGVREIERTLIAHSRPVAVGIPGYVVPEDQTASLFVKAPSHLVACQTEPPGGLELSPAGEQNGWTRFTVRGRTWGGIRLTLTYANGEKQTISYFVTKPLDRALADLGAFTTTHQWYEGKGDPFGRSPGLLTFDKEADAVVLTDHRPWIAGMSDEGGAGGFVAAFMKQLDNPNAVEIAKLERLIDGTIVGRLQVAEGPHAGAVRKSLFYYDPERFPDLYSGGNADWWKWTWRKDEADRLDRSYNYPHVAIVHWVMYRLARNHRGLVRRHDWRWYLNHAYLTIVAMMRDASLYAEFGLMEGDVFVDILKDLRRETWTDQANEVERLMRSRANHWRSLKYPFGSEMPWDSTGQPEVYAWMRYFGFETQANETGKVILAYDSTVPNWGYNGNARRYWDFGTGGKYERAERMIHHYGSALNAVPLFDAYRRDPTDLYLLRVAYGGSMGGITNIDQAGFASTGFHAWPDMMKWDPYSGDYGMGLYGHASTAASYLVHDEVFGWLGFGGNIRVESDSILIVPKDGARTRLFVAPAGLWITLEAGKIAESRYWPATGRISLTLDPASSTTPVARVALQITVQGRKSRKIARAGFERGAFVVPLPARPKRIELVHT